MIKVADLERKKLNFLISCQLLSQITKLKFLIHFRDLKIRKKYYNLGRNSNSTYKTTEWLWFFKFNFFRVTEWAGWRPTLRPFRPLALMSSLTTQGTVNFTLNNTVNTNSETFPEPVYSEVADSNLYIW